MAKSRTICNMCGKEFNMWDESENRGVHDQFGYGSKYDGDYINLDLCCDCFDKVIDWIKDNSKINPIEERDY